MKKHRVILITLLSFVFILSNCSPKIILPPKIDLRSQGKIGMIDFTSNSEGDFDHFASQKFLEIIQKSQPELQIFELGSEEEVLKSVGREKLDLEAFKEIGALHDLEMIIIGSLQITDVKPKIEISPWVNLASIQAVVKATINAKLMKTSNGATFWTTISEAEDNVAGITLLSGGPVIFDAQDPESAYGKLVRELIQRATEDFRTRRVREKDLR